MAKAESKHSGQNPLNHFSVIAQFLSH